jgi:acyl transferase domain-containing protein
MYRPAAFMFSGQGSQYYHMGRELFDGHATFRSKMIEMDKIAADVTGCSIVDALYYAGKAKDEPFDRTPLTNGALFMVEYALVEALIADGLAPDLLVSTSMGIFAAAAVASVISVEDALTATMKLGSILDAQCRKGAMLALLADSKLYEQMDALKAGTELAALNFASHFVVSTTHDYLGTLLPILTGKGIAFSKLPVSVAFHSRWIDDAEDAALTLFSGLRYRSPRIPLVCCGQTTTLETPGPEHLWSSLRHPIRFSATIARLESEGPRCYIDVGPAGTLATFLKRSLARDSRSRTIPLLTPFGTGFKNYTALKSAAGALTIARDDRTAGDQPALSA